MDESWPDRFPHHWKAEVLPARPLILPRVHRVYPLALPGEEDAIARGALEVLVTPRVGERFLATCMLGFEAASLPTGIWSCPQPDWLCAIAGGYAYLIDTTAPQTWEQVEYRPVVEVRSLLEEGLLLFAGFHTLTAYGVEGRRWKTQRLTAEGLRLGNVYASQLQGWGWDMRTDREIEFRVDLSNGEHEGGPAL
jgi:hypothetical protein